MGAPGGMPGTPEALVACRRELPEGATFSATGLGPAALPVLMTALAAGGHVRVGLEDAVYLDRGVLALSNAAMVEKARRIVEDLGGQIASLREARDLIGLPTRPRPARRAA